MVFTKAVQLLREAVQMNEDEMQDGPTFVSV